MCYKVAQELWSWEACLSHTYCFSSQIRHSKNAFHLVGDWVKGNKVLLVEAPPWRDLRARKWRLSSKHSEWLAINMGWPPSLTIYSVGLSGKDIGTRTKHQEVQALMCTKTLFKWKLGHEKIGFCHLSSPRFMLFSAFHNLDEMPAAKCSLQRQRAWHLHAVAYWEIYVET